MSLAESEVRATCWPESPTCTGWRASVPVLVDRGSRSYGWLRPVEFRAVVSAPPTGHLFAQAPLADFRAEFAIREARAPALRVLRWRRATLQPELGVPPLGAAFPPAGFSSAVGSSPTGLP